MLNLRCLLQQGILHKRSGKLRKPTKRLDPACRKASFGALNEPQSFKSGQLV